MHFDLALTRLHLALREPLPGEAAHALMAPRPRRDWPPGMGPDRVREAAGLLVVTPRANEGAHLVLTVRAETLGRHRGSSPVFIRIAQRGRPPLVHRLADEHFVKLGDDLVEAIDSVLGPGSASLR